MRKYLLTADRLEGTITFGYDAREVLVLLEVAMPALTPGNLRWFIAELSNCIDAGSLKAWARAHKFHIAELGEDLSFERFWDEYKMKRNKDRAEDIWKRMSDEDKALVFANIPAYHRYRVRKGGWYNPLYPDNYLQNRNWKDEWDKL